VVLLVESDAALREHYAAELAAAGFTVLEAFDGAEAIEKALLLGPHAVVVDLMLSGVDGFRVVRRLRQDDRTRDMALVALSTLPAARFEPLALGAGFDGFLSKPVLSTALVGEILRQIERRVRETTEEGWDRISRRR
jgi:DNA-binding response OmpR family regulator